MSGEHRPRPHRLINPENRVGAVTTDRDRVGYQQRRRLHGSDPRSARTPESRRNRES
jgi:hypothetical protein